MKQSSTQRVRVPFKMCLVLSLTIFSMMFSMTSSAHNVRYFNPPCFAQGSNITVPVWIANSSATSRYHWQYRVPGGAWTWLSNGNNTINGRIFSVANANITSTISVHSNATGALLNPTLAINNVGTPTNPTASYTTQLDNIEVRVIMTDGLDPQTNPYPGTPAWGGEEFANPFEAKYIRLISRPNVSTPCYSNCSGNVLVINPANTNPPIEEYFGGFEIGVGTGTENFSTPGVNGVTTKAATDLTQWTTGAFTSRYRVINNPDSVNSGLNAIAPHSGRFMMIANVNSNATRIWQRTITTTGTNVYNGQVTFKAWFSKINAGTNPCMTMEVKGATTQAGAVAAITGGSTSTTITGTSGNWVQISVTVTLPLSTLKKLEFSIHSCSGASAVNVAVDDICLIEPAAGPLPVVLTGLKGAYSNGVAKLTWGTEQESNSSHFEIERSNDGNNFTMLGKVAAAGNSSKAVAYNFNDVKVNAGTNYYRLRMVDKDGRFEYSNIVALNVNIKGFFVTSIYPSPFADKVSVSISSENAATGTVRLMDNTGKVLARQNSQIRKGITTISLDNLGSLAKGFYIIEVQSGETVVTQKLMK